MIWPSTEIRDNIFTRFHPKLFSPVPDLSRKRERERLVIRHTRTSNASVEERSWVFVRGPDTWSARYRPREGKQSHKFLGGLLEFDEAKRQAEA